jgi:hypothetical protein
MFDNGSHWVQANRDGLLTPCQVIPGSAISPANVHRFALAKLLVDLVFLAKVVEQYLLPARRRSLTLE